MLKSLQDNSSREPVSALGALGINATLLETAT
jgi:hypothetical protein